MPPMDNRAPPLNQSSSQAATLSHSAAQALQASPQVLHSATLGYFSHAFWQSLQTIATGFAKWPVCSELTAASAASASQAATSWKAASAQSDMLVSFILYMPRQCRRQSLPVATHSTVAFSRALYCGGCIVCSSAAICAKACDVEATAATVPAAAMNSRRSMVFLLVGFE